MNDGFENWLRKRTRLDGILAASVRDPERSITEVYCSELSFEAVETTCRYLCDTVSSIEEHSVKSGQQQWVFDHARLHYFHRGDGVELAIIAEKERPPLPVMRQLLLEFEQFNPQFQT